MACRIFPPSATASSRIRIVNTIDNTWRPSMACLFKRSNGYYYFAVWEKGRRVYKSTGQRNRSAALEVLRKWKPDSSREISLKGFFDEFLAYASATFAQRNVENYQRVFKHALSFFGNKDLDLISSHDLEKFKIWRLSEASPTTVNIDLKTLKAALNKAVEWEMLPKNPCSRVSPVRVPMRSPAFLTQAEFEKLYFAIQERWLKDIVLFAVLTGMRQGEIINLQWKNVDLRGACLHIRNSSSFSAKMGKERTIPINHLGLELLKTRARATDHVFTYGDGRRIKRDHLTHRFKNYVRISDLNESVHFHSLRHTFASWLVQAGVPIYTVQKLLGHSSVRITEIYSHLADENLRDSIELLPNVGEFPTKVSFSKSAIIRLKDLTVTLKDLSRN
jgi:integrase